ncbi:MAG: hypothetical protein ACI9KE_001928 [Polyangiales bacterium]|jgi:hypothetical protein
MIRVFVSFLVLAACSSSHNNQLDEDAGPDAIAVDASAPDSQTPDVLDAGAVVLECPPGIDPYAAPYEACSPEGATCREGSGQCGSLLACECTDGLWNCLFAHPDPVCTCGREPSEGDPCVEEGALCGECCPAAGDPDWAPMTCVEGSWQPAGCPPIECPAVTASCPVNPADHVGDDCFNEGLSCGNACCGTGIDCNGGIWRPGPDAECLCEPQRPCGPGTCRNNQYCVQSCGPDDGPEYACEALPEACFDCSCISLETGGRCEMVDGAPVIGHFCG